MTTTDELSGKIYAALGDNQKLDSNEYDAVLDLVDADGQIDAQDIQKLKAAGISPKEIEALLIHRYGHNDKGIIELLLDGATNVTLTAKDKGNENTEDDKLNSVFA